MLEKQVNEERKVVTALLNADLESYKALMKVRGEK